MSLQHVVADIIYDVNSKPEIVHIVLFKLKSAAVEEAKQAINALKNVPGPEVVSVLRPAQSSMFYT